MTIYYTQKYIDELIKQAEETLAYAKMKLASFEVDAQPQTPTTKGE
jgi:hypothetical protein